MPRKAKGKKSRLLLYLILVMAATSLAATGTLAKYSSTFGVNASIEVAAFAGGGAMDFDVPLDNMTPGSTRTMQFTVQNYDEKRDCEVQLDYEIQVETTGNLPLSFQLLGKKTADDSSADSVLAGPLNSSLKASGGKLPIAAGGDGETGAGRKQHTYELSVTWPAGETDEDYSREIDMVTVTVTTTQADPSAG